MIMKRMSFSLLEETGPERLPRQNRLSTARRTGAPTIDTPCKKIFQRS